MSEFEQLENNDSIMQGEHMPIFERQEIIDRSNDEIVNFNSKSTKIKSKGFKGLNAFSNKKKKKKVKPKLYLRWGLYFILFSILVLAFHGWSEWHIVSNQPSANWSVGLEIAKDLPVDYRLVSQSLTPKEDGLVLAYVTPTSMQVKFFNLYGELVNQVKYPLSDTSIIASKVKVIQLSQAKDYNYLYYSDRVSLYRLKIDAATNSVGEETLISKHSEQFAVSDNYVIAGDDEVTMLYKGLDEIASLNDYENLKKVCIYSNEDQLYATLNADDGGRLLTFENERLVDVKIAEVRDQRTYGYFKDIYVDNGVITLVTSIFDHLSPSSPTILGVWQLKQSNFEIESFKLFYHVRTSLDPVIAKVDGQKVSYILGTQQTLDTASKGLSRYPQTKGGTFTNISYFTREQDRLIENTRISMTRRYPVGYDYFQTEKGDLLTWVDKENGKGILTMAGNYPEWIAYAQSEIKPDVKSLLSYSVVAVINVVFLGTFSLLIALTNYVYYIIAFVVLIYIYNRWFPGEPKKKNMYVLIASIVFTTLISIIVIANPNSDFRFYSEIYPWFFGSTIAMVLIPLLVAIASLFIFTLWHKQHYYYENRFLQFSFFFGIEIYFYLITVMAFFVAAMMKNNQMM